MAKMNEITMRVQMDPERVNAMEKAKDDLQATCSELDTNLWALRRSISELEFQVKRVDDADKLHDNFETFYNENTLFKIHQALDGLLLINGRSLAESDVTDIINALQNYGILFRERA